MDALLVFLIAAAASFIGSLQAGLVNTAVLAATLRRGPASGMRTAWGGCIPEFLYAAVAYVAADHVLAWAGGFGGTAERVTGAVMIALGIYFVCFLRPFPTAMRPGGRHTGFRNGLLLGLMNPQLLLFWCGVRLVIDGLGIDATGVAAIIAFGLGAFGGAMLLLVLLVRLGERMQERLGGRTLHVIFRAVGAVLVVIGAVLVVRR
ncbi:MAG: LysE family transporter [Flavobacteriales bacterium]|jgi:threonine/homoserine/homoserine lactone efflux protein|nr:LysE family transporter [Flavobacteriales bacterium]